MCMCTHFDVFFFQFQHQSTILNDESGSGKCFQCIALFDAILRASPSTRILIICKSKQNVEHWQYHVDCFLRNVSAKIADNEKGKVGADAVTIASLDHVLANFGTFTTTENDCVVVQDQYSDVSAHVFDRLKKIKSKCKIILCSNDLMVNQIFSSQFLEQIFNALKLFFLSGKSNLLL